MTALEWAALALYAIGFFDAMADCERHVPGSSVTRQALVASVWPLWSLHRIFGEKP